MVYSLVIASSIRNNNNITGTQKAKALKELYDKTFDGIFQTTLNMVISEHNLCPICCEELKYKNIDDEQIDKIVLSHRLRYCPSCGWKG